MLVPLYDDDGHPVNGKPVVPKLTADARRKQQLAALEKAKRQRAVNLEMGSTRGRRDARQLALRHWVVSLLDDPRYRSNFKRRLLTGELATPLEILAWHYAVGKPTETHEHVISTTATTINLEHLNDQQLALLKAMLQNTVAAQVLDAETDDVDAAPA